MRSCKLHVTSTVSRLVEDGPGRMHLLTRILLFEASNLVLLGTKLVLRTSAEDLALINSRR